MIFFKWFEIYFRNLFLDFDWEEVELSNDDIERSWRVWIVGNGRKKI